MGEPMKKIATFIFLVSCFLPYFAFAGVADTIRRELMEKCNLTLTSEQVLPTVQKMYMTCTPGQDVRINEACIVSCMKKNTSNVIGK